MPDAKRTVHAVELGDVTKHNLKQLRVLNQALFPVAYNEKFYTDVLQAGNFVKLAWYNDVMVGAVCCRVDREPNGDKKVYIMTMGCLEQYRGVGVGTALVQHILRQCEKDPKITEVYLHVQVNNENAIKFYEKFGFRITSTVEDYYKKIEPAAAHVLTKTLTPGDESQN